MKSKTINDFFVADMIFIYEKSFDNDYRLFDKYIKSGVNFIQGHPAGDAHNVSQAVQRISAMRRDIKLNADICELVLSVDDVRAAHSKGKLAVSIQLEGFRCLERNLDMIDTYYDLGVRLCHPIFNVSNEIGGGCADGNEFGLTRYGRAVVQRMNEVGMIVDGAHCGHKTQLDMLEFSDAPVVYTHHGAYTLHNHLRNLRDDVIKGCAQKGGVIGISGAGYYLGGHPTPELLFKHVDYVVQMVGSEHVGIALDWCANAQHVSDQMKRDPNDWPNGPEYWAPVEFSPPSFFPALLELMNKAGYSDQAIAGLLGENWMRVCRQVWK